MSQQISELIDPRPVASYQSYAAAKSAVAILTADGVSAQKLTIVGLGLQPMDQARVTWGRVVLTGVLTGVMWGLMLSVLLWVFLPGHPLWLLVSYGIGFGMVFGILAQAVQHAMTHTSRFVARTMAVATRFQVQAEAGVAKQAREILGTLQTVDGKHESRPRRSAEDEAWLAQSKPKPVPAEVAPQLAEMPTEVMKLKSDWLDDPSGWPDEGASEPK